MTINTKLKESTPEKPIDPLGIEARLEYVCNGLAAGKSRRLIAKELGLDESTIRRDIKVMLLPEKHLNAILSGSSTEKQLRSAQHEAAEDARRLAVAVEKQAAETSRARRLSEEKLTGRHSNALALLLLRWLDLKLPYEAYKEQLMQIVDRKNWATGELLAVPMNPNNMLVNCERGPAPTYGPDQIEFYAAVLAQALPAIAPEGLIRNQAIAKTRRAIENPRKYLPELRP
jgi:hypothetical protein